MAGVLVWLSIPAVFIVSLLSAACPKIVAKYSPSLDIARSKAFQFLAGCGAGAILSIGLVHSFAEGVEALGYAVEEGALPEYAWGGLFALLGTLATLAMELLVDWMVSLMIEQRNAEVQSKGKAEAVDEDSEGDSDTTKQTADEVEVQSEVEQSKDAAEGCCDSVALQTYAELYALLFGIAFHSVFVGFTLGLSNGKVGLVVAVLVHQLFEGIALGTKILLSDISSTVNIVFLELCFAISTPLGIAAGLAVSSIIEEEPVYYAVVEGTFQSFSAGILVYVAMLHFIYEELERPGNVPAILYSGIVVGAAILAIAGFWV